jgi:hypothetical protein
VLEKMRLSLTDASSNLLKYRAIYEFVARNSDELSFQPGDVIMVSFIHFFAAPRVSQKWSFIFLFYAFLSSKSIWHTGYSKS